jgi:putative NADH-flavin reductase
VESYRKGGEKMILIVGASGFLGRKVASLLLSQGQQVRLLVRTPAKVDDLRQRGAEIMQGDLVDPLSLRRACQGTDEVLAAAHSLLGKGRYKSEAVDDAGHRDLIDAAKKAGVAHFVHTSLLGAAPGHPIDFFRTKYRVKEYLKASSLSYTILRPSAFMEPKLKDRTLDVGGPGNFTNNQVAQLYGKLAGITPKVSHLPPTIARILSVVLKPFQPGVSRIMYMNSLPDDAFSETFDPTALLAEFPMHLTTLEEFVRERVAEAKQPSG